MPASCVQADEAEEDFSGRHLVLHLVEAVLQQTEGGVVPWGLPPKG